MTKYIFIILLVTIGSKNMAAQGEIKDSLRDKVSVSLHVFNKMPGLFFEAGLNWRPLSNDQVNEVNLGFGFRNSYVASCGFVGEIYRHKMKVICLGGSYFYFNGGKYHFEPNSGSASSLYEGSDIHVLRPSLNMRLYLENDVRIQFSLGYGFMVNKSYYKLVSGPDEYDRQMNYEFSDGIICGVDLFFRIR